MNILYTGAFRYPDGDAAAQRVLMVSKAMRKAGWKVEILSWGMHGSGLHEGFYYESTCDLKATERKTNFLARVINFVFLGKNALKKIIVKCRGNQKPNVIVVYNPSVFFTLSVLLYCKLFRIRCVLDITEWYESTHLKGGRLGLPSIENAIRMKLANKLYKNYICISEYLERHFYKKNKNIVVIPALMEVNKIKEKVNCAKSLGLIRLVFAGVAGKKDNLQTAIESVLYANRTNKKRKVEIHIVGPEKKEILNYFKDLQEIYTPEEFEAIITYGRVKRDIVAKIYAKAHFSVIFRENLRYARAGFPTKSVESWSYGVPIITNAVGEFAKYCNKKNALVIKKDSEAKERISIFLSNLTSEDYRIMSEESKKTAIKNFNYCNYVSALRHVVEE